ncbi:hypothetical protein AURDEDRAFT_155209 [Auricularia subglabra TFB-10046 SS5]|nr:hypothetical protein AURDEDRAFT_155209 [Auricularia subglabra TFB-10046 SS5]
MFEVHAGDTLSVLDHSSYDEAAGRSVSLADGPILVPNSTTSFFGGGRTDNDDTASREGDGDSSDEVESIGHEATDDESQDPDAPVTPPRIRRFAWKPAKDLSPHSSRAHDTALQIGESHTYSPFTDKAVNDALCRSTSPEEVTSFSETSWRAMTRSKNSDSGPGDRPGSPVAGDGQMIKDDPETSVVSLPSPHSGQQSLTLFADVPSDTTVEALDV